MNQEEVKREIERDRQTDREKGENSEQQCAIDSSKMVDMQS